MKDETTEVVPSRRSEVVEPNVGRRNLALTMLGALGAAAMVGTRGTAKPVAEVKPEPTVNAQGAPPTTGTEIMWVDTVFGSGGPKARGNGDLNKGPLALSTSKPPMVVIATGSVTIGDGGGGVFFWRPDPNPPDDGGTKIEPKILLPVPPGGGQSANGNGQGHGPPVIIEAQKGYWHRIYDGPLNVKWFGTGEFARIGIQAAIEAATNAGGGGVYIPPGSYDIDEAIEVKSNVELRGAGPGTILRLKDIMDPNLELMIHFKRVVIKVQGGKNIRIADLQIDGNKGAVPRHCDSSTQNGILIRYGLIVDGNGAPSGTFPSEDILVENCLVINCNWHGIGVLSSNRVTVRNCTVKDCGKEDAQANGIDFSWQPSPLSRTAGNGMTNGEELYGVSKGLEDCVAEGCSSFGSQHNGIELFGVYAFRTTIRNCHTDSIIVNFADYGGLDSNVEPMILDCTVDHTTRNVSDEAINLNEASGALVANCRLIATQGALKLHAQNNRRSHGNTIVGNTMIYKGTCHPATNACCTGDSYTRSGPCGVWTSISPGGPSPGVLVIGGSDLVIGSNIMTGFTEGITVLTSTHGVVAKNTAVSEIWPKVLFCTEPNKLSLTLYTKGVALQLATIGVSVTKNSFRVHNYGVYEDTASSENVYAYNILRGNAESWNPINGTGPNFLQRSEHNMI